MNNNDFGAYPIHPGELLKDEIECRKISQRKLAESIGMSHTALNEILNAKRPISIQTAYLIEAAMDLPAHILIGMQSRYDIQTMKANKSFLARLAAVRKIAAVL